MASHIILRTRSTAVIGCALNLTLRPAVFSFAKFSTANLNSRLSSCSPIMSSMPIKRLTGATTQFVSIRHASSFPEHTLITMPALSPTMTQGNIGKWNKKPGDSIQPGDAIVEIETDKATMDFEAQEDGFIAKILLQEGEKDVLVNRPIAVLVESKDLVAAFESFTLADAGSETAAAPEVVLTPTTAINSATKQSISTPASSVDRIIASPLAKSVAAQKGVVLQQIQGTGPGGRIIRADVDAFQPITAASPSAPTPIAVSAAAFEDIPISTIRKVIATRLTQSKTQVPHYQVTAEIVMDKILKLREVLNKDSNGAFKLSVNDFVIKASSKALIDVPEVNSAWQDTFIRQFKSADIAIAVATETGLITPIVTGAEAKGLTSISNSVKDLAARAKLGKLAPNEYQGGSFTISNLGMFAGIDQFTAIINQPHAAILAVGATSDKLIIDETSEKGFSVSKVMKVTLSADHRVVDGAVAAKWLQKFKGYIENPLTLIL
ncbi:pyruvate dehydrogenase complex dihydrolipoamide acetyltransferase component (E2) [Nowakowskiella sp. JEL0078]|nr:pyruvate dehydrogenase complex dihydrolipoamide acetyltransferase component (E2) [Nowakowskiella sp. JEL0078]